MTKKRKKKMKRLKKRKAKKSSRKKKVSRNGGNGTLPKYTLNYRFHLINELRDLIFKSSPDEMDRVSEKLQKIGRIKLAIVTGIFVNKPNAESANTDLLLVADDIDRRKLRALIKSLEADIGKEIRFVVLEKDEFDYRIGMFDRFIRVLLEGPHEKLINRLGI